jgi:ABC-2 type transport system permease protein
VKAVLHLTKFSLRSMVRNPRAVVFTLLFPIVMLVLFNAVFAAGSDDHTVVPGGLDLDLDAYFTAGILAYAIVMATYSSLAIGLVSERESGELKRLRGTPMPSWAFVSSLVVRSVLLVALMTVIVLLIGRFAYGVHFPGDNVLGLVVYLVLGTSMFCTLGVALTVVTPSVDAVSTIAPFSAILLSFISGVFIPVEQLPKWAEEIGRIFPLAHLASGLQTTFSPDADNLGLSATNVAVLGAWHLAALAVAVRRFRWEPVAARG